MAPKRQEVGSQATPLAQDILEMLRGQLAEGSFGVGVGPLQQQAGTAASQFVSSGGLEQLSPLIKELEKIQNRRVGEATGNLKESFGIAGSRFGTPLATGQAKLVTDLESEFSAGIGQLLLGQRQQQLQGIGLLQGIGQQNIAPFLGLASQGINPDVFTQNPFLTALSALSGAAEGVAGAAG